MIVTMPRCALAILIAVLGATTARADEAAPAAASSPSLLRFGMWDDEGWYQEGYFQGDQRLGRDAFLIAAGRRDVVDRVKHRRWLRVGLLGGGALIGLSGLAYILTRPSCDDVVDGPGPGNPLQDCLDDRGSARLLGTLVAIAGGGTMIGGFALGHLRPDRAELRAIAHAHNQRQRPPTQGTAIVVAPTVSPRSAGVVLSFSF